jgi:hypothetical protein
MNYYRRQPSAAKQHKKRIFSYFFHLDEKDITDFEITWQAIRHQKFDAKSLANIIHKIAKNLSDDHQDMDRYAGVIENLEGNKTIWEDEAIENMDKFNPYDLSISLWAFATLGIVPSKKFMKAWKAQAQETINSFNDQDLSNSVWALAVIDSLEPNPRNRDIYNILRDNLTLEQYRKRHKKQNYDADLWFRGSSDFTNPQGKPTHSAAEEELCCIFNKAGFKAEVLKKPTIQSLPQAIDIRIFDPKTKKTIYVEFDGDTHFLNTQKAKEQLRYNGQTIFRSGLIHKEAPDLHILRIDMNILVQLKEWDKNNARTSSGKLRSDLACGLFFDRTVNQDPDMYRAQMDSKHPVVSMTRGSSPSKLAA